MRSEIEKQLALRLRRKGKSYTEIGNIMDVSKDTARNLCRKLKECRIKSGPKSYLSRYNEFSIKMKVIRKN